MDFPNKRRLCSRAINDTLCTGNAMPVVNRRSSSLPKMKLSEKFCEIYNLASEHDRMIVNRMTMKRTKDQAMMDDAQVARKYWEQERIARNLIMLEHNETLNRLLKDRRDRDRQEAAARIENLRNRDQWLMYRLRQELDHRDERISTRLQRLNQIRDNQVNEKRSMQMEKARIIAANIEGSNLDKRLQQQLVLNQLEEKICRAECQRQKYIDVQKNRLRFDNEMEQRMHQSKFEEIQKFEQFQKQRLMDCIRRQDARAESFVEQKRKEIVESRTMAFNSAFLRDYVKRSFTPEVYSMGANNMYSTRSFQSV